MNKRENQIIKLMRNGKRLNISEIARELGLPTSTVSDTIRRIEKKYAIKRSSLLDFQKLGYSSRAFVAVRVDSRQKRRFFDFLKQQNCVNSLYYINSSFDFMVDVLFKDAIELKYWIETARRHFSLEVYVFHVLKTEDVERFLQ